MPMEEGQQSGAVEVESTEEATPVRIQESPNLPTISDIEKHRAEGHIPYRSWCPDCNNGQCREGQHHACDQEIKKIAVIAMDYLYVTGRAIYYARELEQIPEE